MEPPLRLTARQCDHPLPCVLKAPCSPYQAPYTASIHNDYSRISTIPRHKSLPSIQATMYSADSSQKEKVRSVQRSGSVNALQRSVSGMKALLPLKLSSSMASSTWSSPARIQRSGNDSTLRKPHHSPKRKSNAPQSMIIPREQYRDTPVYTEPGSPLLNLAYYTDEEVCLSSSPIEPCCDESSIIHGDASSCGGSEERDPEDKVGETSLPGGPKRINPPSRNSDLSFRCLGESGSLFKSLLRDEGAWLSSPKAESLPQLLAESLPVEHDLEGWLSDTSSICGDDSYACATALAPARAQVVDINTYRLSIKIPPRSSSLAGTQLQSLSPDEGRKSRATFRDGPEVDHFDPWVEDGVPNATKPWLSQLPPLKNNYDLSLPSPPLSPIQLGSTRNRTGVNFRRNAAAHTYDFAGSAASGQDSMFQIISALAESTSQFPSSTLHPESPCISAIRIHLHQSSPQSYPQWEVPAPLPSPFSEGVDWRPRPNPSPSTHRPKTSYITSLQRTFSSRTSRTMPIPKYDRNQQTQDMHDTPPPLPAEPNLQPFSAIFPSTTSYLRSALYAHILAYIFVTSLPEYYAIPQTHTPPPSPIKLRYYSTTSQSIPQKAADRLGIPVPATPRKIDVADDAINLRQSRMGSGVVMLAEKLRSNIGWLIAKMSDDRNEKEEGAGRVDASFLRALEEVVKGCERDSFGYS